MEYRWLGNTGLKVSALALRASDATAERLGRSGLREAVAQAMDAGIHLFHGSGQGEALLGDVLADLRFAPAQRCVLSCVQGEAGMQTHPLQQGLSRKSLRSACEASLRHLHADYLDLLLCQRPDPHTPLHETVAALDQLIRAGKLLHWGVSEWPAETIAEAIAIAQAQGMSAPSFELVHDATAAASGLGLLLDWPEFEPPPDAHALRSLLDRSPQVASLVLDAGQLPRFDGF